MLHLHHSNRLERLRAALLQRLGAAGADVFAAEQVIVPGAALRRDLSLAIADARGICANVRFGFLAQWLWQQVARIVPGVGDDSPFAPEVLTWRVHAALEDADFVSRHPRLQQGLRDADALLRYELACQIAGQLERYVTYRADWLQAWHDGRAADLGPLAQRAGHAGTAQATPGEAQDEAWQAALWRRVVAELGPHAEHPVAAFVAALQRGGTALARRAGLPGCVHVFALPAMAPLHLRLLQQLAGWIDIHVYVLNPCQEYWFDLVDRRRLGHLAARGQVTGLEEEGNRLLAAWGRQTQVYIEALVDAGGEGSVDDADFEAAPGTSLLAQLQNAVLELRPIDPGTLTLADGDRSIEVHVCHSLTRELEALQDHLLGLFAADDGLCPGDVLVVTPELDAAAPLIDAVFGTAPKDRRLPYALCGAVRSRANPIAGALLSLLALAGSRCRAGEVFGLLQQAAVARRFGLDDDALARVHGWLREAGFHWALDSAQRARFGVPATPRHTLDDALQRLFLGHALPPSCTEPFDGRLGAGDAEGSEALALGALWHFAGRLGRHVAGLQQPRPPEAWASLLSTLVEEFLEPADDQLEDLRELQQAIAALADEWRRGGVARALPLPVVRAALQRRLDAAGAGGAAGGSINFASMSSLRGLPFAVICAVGLNDGAFPGLQRPLEFDLMAAHPRRGDRLRREDERAAMLDLLLAARRSLYLSYTGHSQRDNAPLPPSVLVAELRELLVSAVAADPDDAACVAAAHRRLVVEHPLQPFSQTAFDARSDLRVRSHDGDLAAALRHSRPGAAAPAAAAGDVEAEDDEDAAADTALHTRFFVQPLPAPGAEWRQVALPQLQEFFRNPCRMLLRRRLGIDLLREAEELQDDEPMLPDGAARRALSRRLLPLLLAGARPAELPELARAGSEWPAGAYGEAELQAELQALAQFAGRVRDAQAEATLPPQGLWLQADLQGEPWQLQAEFADLRASGLLRWRAGPTRPGDYLDAWLQHLALCAAAPPGVARSTRWLSSDGEFELRPCGDARAQLQALLAIYRQGLQAPLRFFPRSAWEFATRGSEAARRSWHPGAFQPHAEGSDPAYRLALRGVEDPLDDEFRRLATAMFGPLQAHLQDRRR